MSDLVEKWRLAAAEWLDAKEAASLLRETKNDVFAEIKSKMNASSEAERDRQARLSTEWAVHRSKMLEAEKTERRLSMGVKYRQMQFDAWRTEAANNRQERGNY
jgi:hypothetical protein